MATLDTRIDKLAGPDLPPVNPIFYLAAELALAHPDHERLLAGVVEANRTGRLPADPLVRAFARLVADSLTADEAGLFASDYGEQLYQATDAKYAHAEELAAMDEATAHAVMTQERIMRGVLVEHLREHLPALAAIAVRRHLKQTKGIDRDGD